MSLDTITLEQALQLLSLPRVLGTGADGEEVTARNGRVRAVRAALAKETRSIESEDRLLTINLEEAEALLAQPRQASGAGPAEAAAEGARAGSRDGQAMVVKEGRFGPYVTDGETNASLRQGDDPSPLTVERAQELLADRRARGPAAKPSRKRKTS
jgi:DNA topoisomerase-1